MSLKQVDGLKSKEVVWLPVFGDDYCYASWCTIVEIEKIPVYDPSAVTKWRFKKFYKITYTPNKGSKKELPHIGYYPEGDKLKIPPKPGYFTRVLKAIASY